MLALQPLSVQVEKEASFAFTVAVRKEVIAATVERRNCIGMFGMGEL